MCVVLVIMPWETFSEPDFRGMTLNGLLSDFLEELALPAVIHPENNSRYIATSITERESLN